MTTLFTLHGVEPLVHGDGGVHHLQEGSFEARHSNGSTCSRGRALVFACATDCATFVRTRWMRGATSHVTCLDSHTAIEEK